MKTETLTLTDALAEIKGRFGGDMTTPQSVLEMEKRRDHNAHFIDRGLQELNEAFRMLCRDNPKLLEMIGLCREKLKGDPYSNCFGENPKEAMASYFSGSGGVVILYRFGFSNVNQTLSLAILPDDRIALVTNTDVSVMQFFYHRLVQMSEIHPASYNAPLGIWLQQLTNGSSGHDEFLHVLYHRIQQILLAPKE